MILPKTNSIVRASLKSFMRNKTSMLLLIVSPVILISIIFLSFNPTGLQKIPVGTSGYSHSLDMGELQDDYFSYLDVKDFRTLDDCLSEMKMYRRYICMDIEEDDGLKIDIFYDNTREPVIWEIIQRIKSTIDLLQKEKTKSTASGFLEKVKTADEKLEAYREEMETVRGEIDYYIVEIDNTKNEMRSSRNELSSTLYTMDSDINEAETQLDALEQEKDWAYQRSMERLDQIRSMTFDLNYTIGRPIRDTAMNVRNDLTSYNNMADSSLYAAGSKIRSYKTASTRGRGYINTLDQKIANLDNVRLQLSDYKDKINSTNAEIVDIQEEIGELKEVDLDDFINPISVDMLPEYVPEVDYSDYSQEDIQTGINMISLQTIFPTILFLIILFLSLLISNFICLSEINSPSYKRINLVKNIFFSELGAIFLSSLFIVILPIILILLGGQFLFMLKIFQNFLPVMSVILVTCCIFILIGMIVAYLIRKESITLLLATFLLVLFIFFSGVLLPLERMSILSKFFATSSPSHLGISAFNQIVFYGYGGVPMSFTIPAIIWLVSLLVIVSLVKDARD